MSSAHDIYQTISRRTADNLRTVAQADLPPDFTKLSLPEIEAMADAAARAAPAAHVPGVILNGLAQLRGRRPPRAALKQDVNALFQGIESALDQAVYATVFAGPAAVIWGYQNLLRLAGLDPNDTFPDGLWQFYAEYALREDTARHASETHGFDTLLRRHQIVLSPADRLTAWLLTAVHTLHQYNDLLTNEWRERVYAYLLADLTAAQPNAAQSEIDHYAALYRRWEKERPYGRAHDAQPDEDYPSYRRRKFDEFLAANTRRLSPAVYQSWTERILALKPELKAYRRQMTILAYLQPGPYDESRVLIPLAEAKVGLIYDGRYYLLPICAADGRAPIAPAEMRALVAAIVDGQPVADEPPANLTALTTMKRAALADRRPHFNPTLVDSLAQLRQAPILLNGDQRPSTLPLAEIRETERGVGDHALTLFDAGRTMLFDQSHIFFDGAWGAALAEIMTREAQAWAVYLHQVAAETADVTPIRPLSLPMSASERAKIAAAPQISQQVSAENDQINLAQILTTRRLFKLRSDLLDLTVNDLFILYRAIHALAYQPDPALVKALEALRQEPALAEAAVAALTAIAVPPETSPAILIPIDATRRAPRERLYPLVFEAPLHELDLIDLHQMTLAALRQYQNDVGERDATYAQFDQLQRAYLACLAGFGQVLTAAKENAAQGQSASVGALRLLAGIPPAIQCMLDGLPNRFDLLNDLIKGREVFSNIGAVAPTSSLTRFITAKDDNEKKWLSWGALTDAEGVTRLSLRDFRPHVQLLTAVGRRQLAQQITQHYLDSYVVGFNQYLGQVRLITQFSRETVAVRPDNFDFS